MPDIEFDKASQRIVVSIEVPQEGVYLVDVQYQGVKLKNGESTLLALTSNNRHGNIV